MRLRAIFFCFLTVFTASPNISVISEGFLPSRIPNPNLSWERTKSYNLGLDLQILDGITFTAEYYHKRANNIVRQDIAWEYGLGSMEINGGRLTNSGMEYSLNIKPIRNENWGMDYRIEFFEELE